jgi:hypothetical protein
LGWRLLIVAVLSVKVSANASALTPHDVWIQQHFTSNQLANDSISGDLADPDKDGLCNLLEYAFNTDPWVFNAGAQLSVTGNGVSLLHRKNKSASDLTFLVEKSDDLSGSGWQVQQPVSQTTLSDDGWTQSLKLDLPQGGGSKGFFRLRISRASAVAASQAADVLIPIGNSSYENGLSGWSSKGQVAAVNWSSRPPGGGDLALFLSHTPAVDNDAWGEVWQATDTLLAANTSYTLTFSASAANWVPSGEITARIYAWDGSTKTTLAQRSFTVTSNNGAENWTSYTMKLPAADINPGFIGQSIGIEFATSDGNPILVDLASLMAAMDGNKIASPSFENGLAGWSSKGQVNAVDWSSRPLGGGDLALFLSHTPAVDNDAWGEVWQTTSSLVVANTSYTLTFSASAASWVPSGEITAQIYAWNGSTKTTLGLRSFMVTSNNGVENWDAYAMTLPTADIHPGFIGQSIGVSFTTSDGNPILLDLVSLVPTWNENWIVNPSFENGLNDWTQSGQVAIFTRTGYTGTDSNTAFLSSDPSVNGGAWGRVAQDTMMALEAGKDYKLSFWSAAAPWETSNSITATIYAVGVGNLLQQSFPVTATNGVSDWVNYTLTLPAMITSGNPSWAGKTLGVSFSTGTGIPVLLDLVSFAPTTAPQIVPANQFAIQNLVNGSFSAGSLLPWTVADGSRSIASDNSPFTNIYPSNGNALQIYKPLWSSTRAIQASYSFGALGADTVTFSYDFKTSNNLQDVLFVQNVLQTANIAIFRMGTPDGKFTLEDGSGTSGITTLSADSWYNVQATFNRNTWTYSGTITKNGGSSVSWSNRALLGTSTSLGSLLLDQTNISFWDNTTTYDNFSVQTSNPAKHRAMSHRGVPFFPIGLYGSPTPNGQAVVQYSTNEANTRELSAAGFNCYMIPAFNVNPSNLDHADRYGMKVIAGCNELPYRYINDPAQFADGSHFHQKIMAIRSHRALFAYYGIDEPLGNYMWGEYESYSYLQNLLVGARQFVETADPSHPLLLTEAPFSSLDGFAPQAPARVFNKQGCIDFSAGSHAYGMDVYPYYSASSDLTPVAKNVDTCLAVTPSTKPVFAVLQGQAPSEYSGTPTGARPSLVATRYMAYSAIIHGANGLFWWGTDWIQPDSQLWTDIKSVAGEVSQIQDVLAAGSESRSFTLGSPSLIGVRKTYGAYNYLIVANCGFASLTNVSISASGLNVSGNGGKIRVGFENRLITPAGTSWTDNFAPWEVHVYTDDPNLF